MTTEMLLAALGALVLLALTIYLVHLLLRLRAKHAASRRMEQEHSDRNQQLHDERIKSIELLCIAALAGDLDLSEACIRMHKLLSYYPGLQTEWTGQTLASVYEEIQHFATHEARLALTGAERRRQDRERQAIEMRHREALLRSFQALLPRARELQGSRYDIDLARGVRRSE
jgi:hypothetical protein